MTKENIIALSKIIGEMSALISDDTPVDITWLQYWKEAIEKVLESEKD